MDFIIDLIVFVIRALLKQSDRKDTTAPRAQPGGPVAAAINQSRLPALVPRTKAAPPDTVDDGERLRLVLTLLGVIALVIMAVAWFMYMQGWLG